MTNKKIPLQKTSNLVYFLVTSLVFTFANLYFTNILISKLHQGWRFANILIHITYEQNTGAAFSIMQNSTHLLILISFIAIFTLIYYVIKNSNNILKKEILIFSILLAGICGNLYERIAFGFVRDFFDLKFVNFPVFNISDVLINIGILGIILMIIFSKKITD